jgi:hypothetical protein
MLSVKILPFSKRLYSADADVTLIAPNFQGVVHHRFRFSSPPVWVSPCQNREVESKKKPASAFADFRSAKPGPADDRVAAGMWQAIFRPNGRAF